MFATFDPLDFTGGHCCDGAEQCEQREVDADSGAKHGDARVDVGGGAA